MQTKIRLVSVHSGLESKIPYGESPLLLSHLRTVIQSDFKILPDNLFILRDSSQTDSSISDQSALDVSFSCSILSSINYSLFRLFSTFQSPNNSPGPVANPNYSYSTNLWSHRWILLPFRSWRTRS